MPGIAAEPEPEVADAEIVVASAVLPLTEPARNRWDQKQVNVLYAAKAPKDTPLEVFHTYLELAARYDLDPFANEIWLANMGGKNGGQGRLAVLVGRDGFLKVARRDTNFIDVDADVVCENDEFEVVRDGKKRTVKHKYGNPAKRGEVVAAYGILRRKGKPDAYFLAPVDEYAKNPDKSAWSFKHAMMVKCAVSYITRITYGVSGPVPADEIGAGLVLDQAHAEGVPAGAPEPPALPEELEALVERAASLDPLSWRPHEVAARIPDPEDRAYESTVAKVIGEVTEWLAANEPPDADVVVDVSAELQRRWESDPEWRAQVEPELQKHADLEVALDEAVGAGDEANAESLRASVEEAAGALDALGVPAGWWPATDDDA